METNTTPKWRHGEKKALAKEAGVKQTHFSQIIGAKVVPSKDLADRIEAASVAVLGEERKIPAQCLVWPERFPHPLVGTINSRG